MADLDAPKFTDEWFRRSRRTTEVVPPPVSWNGHVTLVCLKALFVIGKATVRQCGLATVMTVALLSASPVEADLIPNSARGVWSTEDCGGSGATFATNSAAIIWWSVHSNEVYVGPAEWVSGSFVLPELAAEYGGAVLPFTDRLQRCGTMPGRLQSLFPESLAVFEAFDQVATQCDGGSMRRCASAVFDMIDVSGDDRFSRAEISRMVRAAAFFVGYDAISSAYDDPLVSLDSIVVISSLRSALQPLVDDLIDSYDFDGDGFLSQEELLQDRSIESLEAAANDLASGVPSVFLTALPGSMSSLMGSVLSATLGSTLPPFLVSNLANLSGSAVSTLADVILRALR